MRRNHAPAAAVGKAGGSFRRTTNARRSDDGIEFSEVRTRKAIKDRCRVAVAQRRDEVGLVAGISEKGLVDCGVVEPRHGARVETERPRTEEDRKSKRMNSSQYSATSMPATA